MRIPFPVPAGPAATVGRGEESSRDVTGDFEISAEAVVVASGGTAAGSEIDFATSYLRHVLAFLGIDDVQIVAADRVLRQGEGEVIQHALDRINRIVPADGALEAAA